MRQEEHCRLLRVEEVASRLNLKPSTIRRMILERKIDVIRPSMRAVRIPESWVERVLAEGFQPAIKTQ